ncbi:CPBP family glutamic-type intramembrane protease [Paraclostridium benzoelyticum]|uniref:CPBP family glutamic-type intramembrane protease n=1 Tax=Paraclostridium benzoelyticum TaxID=1629550 RepID=UPI003D68770F
MINGSLIIPFIETFIFQYLAIGIIRFIKKIKDNNCLIIIISAIAFSLSHYYNVLYIFYSFIMGIFLAYTYILYGKKNYHPFLMVMTIHALRNTITTLILTFL